MSAETVTAPPVARVRVVTRPTVRATAPWWAPLATWQAALVGVLLAGATLRLVALNATGFNSDEAVYAGQAASIAGDGTLAPYFPVFRAHPMLFQTLLSLLYLDGVGDLEGRLLSALFGMGTVVVVFMTGRLLYSRPVGLIAAALIAVMPYQVLVSRQVLLDGPMAFFATVTLYLIARYSTSGSVCWLYAAGGSLGLTFLSKETGALLMGSVYAYFALSREIRVRLRQLVVASLCFLAVAVPYPLSLVFSGKSATGSSFLAWQLFRRPNHGWAFYLMEVPPAIGVVVIALAAYALVAAARAWSWRETLLVAWVGVPVLVFELWSVKGFQYLLPIASPLAVLAARGLLTVPQYVSVPRLSSRALAGALTALTLLTLAVPSWDKAHPATTGTFLAGSGGVPGGREAGTWVNENVPRGSQLLALGPSMANILQFYGHRKAFGLSVSSNPLHRNPTYEPVGNADLRIRQNKLQYVVWDSFSASRSRFFSDQLLRYVERYHGRAVHTETVLTEVDGEDVRRPVIVIYEVRP